MSSNVLALDVGESRVGVAVARADVQVPVALPTLERSSPAFWQKLSDLVVEYDAKEIVIGLPRGLDGQETAQTTAVYSFGNELKTHLGNIRIIWQDEAVTSIKAETVLRQSKKNYSKADIDALAACYILNDYLESQPVTP